MRITVRGDEVLCSAFLQLCFARTQVWNGQLWATKFHPNLPREYAFGSEPLRMARGKFITFEGGEGAGKSTQARLLWQRLNRMGVTTELTREPGGTHFAEAIRSILLDPSLSMRSIRSELLLFYAARADHLDLKIRPALEKGYWVICDRFSDSTRAYQGEIGGDENSRTIAELDAIVVGADQPDLTIILDVEPEIGLRRAVRRTYGSVNSQSRLYAPDQLAFSFAPDRFEALDVDFHKKVRTTYLTIAESEPTRCAVIESVGGITRVSDRVWDILVSRLAGELPPTNGIAS